MLQTTDGKFDELVDDFRDFGIELIFSEEHLELPENGETLKENAVTKAIAALSQTDCEYTLGDDSGVFFDNTDFPGVKSRRWFAEEEDDKSRNLKILEKFKPGTSVNLISVFALAKQNEEVAIFEVNNKFELSDSVKGDYGFGYDPILIPTKELIMDAADTGRITRESASEILEHKLTIGCLTQEEKNAINHRGKIAEEIRKCIESF